MHRLLFALLVLASCAATAATSVGVSISIGDPRFYGHIDIGDYPAPRVLYREPVIIERVRVVPASIYLRVPPGHAKHWSKHCRQYHACGRPVYFVDDRWYNDVYVPRYRERHAEHREERREEYREDRREDRRDDRRDDRREDKHDKGRGHGKGKGHDD